MLSTLCIILRACSALSCPHAQDACETDLATTCSTSIKEMEEDEAKRSSALKCLQQFRDELHSQECRDQVCRGAGGRYRGGWGCGVWEVGLCGFAEACGWVGWGCRGRWGSDFAPQLS